MVDDGRRYDTPQDETTSTAVSISILALCSAGIGRSVLATICIVTTTGIRFTVMAKIAAAQSRQGLEGMFRIFRFWTDFASFTAVGPQEHDTVGIRLLEAESLICRLERVMEQGDVLSGSIGFMIRNQARTRWSPRYLLMLRLDATLNWFPFEVMISAEARLYLQSLREPFNLAHQDKASQHPQSSQSDADVMSSSVPIEKRPIVTDVGFHQAADP